MTTATAEATPRARTRRAAKPTTFRVEFIIGEDRYLVHPVAGADPAVAVRAFRFRKLSGDQAVHDVHQSPEGYVCCDCKGFVRWDHCRHCRTLAALGLVDPALVKRPDQKK